MLLPVFMCSFCPVVGGPRGKEEVVVVGGGPGGVLMAMKLKKLGHPVIILEKSDHIGGKALSVSESLCCVRFNCASRCASLLCSF